LGAEPMVAGWPVLFAAAYSGVVGRDSRITPDCAVVVATSITPRTSQGQPVSSQLGIPECMPVGASTLAQTDPARTQIIKTPRRSTFPAESTSFGYQGAVTSVILSASCTCRILASPTTEPGRRGWKRRLGSPLSAPHFLPCTPTHPDHSPRIPPSTARIE
jgi:hypothetical protein